MTEQYVVSLTDVDATQAALVGGKGANLGELRQIDVRVPPGFCVTTAAYRRMVTLAPALDEHLDRLAAVDPKDRAAIATLSEDVRRTIEATPIPPDVAAEITAALADLGDDAAYAVRSSATAEDLPTASFAGQQDTYLNVVGSAAIVEHVRRCWASLFTERAVTYRRQHGIDHRGVQLAVVVQRMVQPEAAGVLFTADPVTGNRKVSAIEAVLGLGDALVSGSVTPDVFEVRDGDVVRKAIASGNDPALTDRQAVRLAELGRKIEAHFGVPQDIEWCLVDGDVSIVQSRPITTLFPIPVVDDEERHVYVSVGHQQMMTDPMKALGLSVWQLTAGRPMHVAGGRLFVDVAPALASPAIGDGLVEALGRSDPLIGDALRTIVDRNLAEPSLPDPGPAQPPAGSNPVEIETDPAIVERLIERTETSVAAVERDLRDLTGPALFDAIRADLLHLKEVLFDDENVAAIMAGMEASWWLDEHLATWLGETGAADTLTLSAPDNVTSEMGLALLDVADAIRPHPDVVAFLEGVDGDDGFLDEMDDVAGGPTARAAIAVWLDRYGMRCVGEIDITRPRWSERPSALVPVLLGNVRSFEPGEAERRFERGRQRALAWEHELLERLRALPDGDQKAAETERKIDRLRTFIGYREHPKYGLICRYFVYKQALLAEAERLVQAGVLRTRDDIFHLTFDELHDVARTHQVDDDLIRRRKEEFASYHALTPPRVLTSDGEVVTGSYRRDDVPAGALVGLPVSTGTVEGRARVIDDMTEADLEPGDILVTTHTDPSWTPLFVVVAGLVTEVGGSMTHGAVIAREYGLPAVVGVQDATRLIADGQRIRLHGTAGYVELLA